MIIHYELTGLPAEILGYSLIAAAIVVVAVATIIAVPFLGAFAEGFGDLFRESRMAYRLTVFTAYRICKAAKRPFSRKRAWQTFFRINTNAAARSRNRLLVLNKIVETMNGDMQDSDKLECVADILNAYKE